MLYNKIENTNVLYLLNLLNKQNKIATILESISNWVEELIPDAIVSIMLLSEDGKYLNLVSSHNKLSKNYQNAIKNLKIGPEIGSCGAAAYLKKMVICEDLESHPNWKEFKDHVVSENIASCWSVPILNTENMIYGTFGTYYRHSKSPTKDEIQKLYEISALIGLSLDFYYEREHKNTLYDKYHSFYDNNPAAIYEIDLDGIILNVNETSRQIHGFKVDRMIGTHYLNRFADNYHNVIEHAFTHAKQGNIQQLEIPVFSVVGQIYYADLTYMPIFKNHEVIGVLAISKDISAQYELKQKLNLLKRGIDASPNGLTILTKDHLNYKIVYANPAFLEMTGFTQQDILGNNCHFLQGTATDPASVQDILAAIQKNESVNVTLKNYKKDGTWFWNELTLGPVFDENKNCTHFICTQQDVTKKRLDQEYIIFQQTHDNLTHLINHQTFKKDLEDAFQTNNNELVVLYIDLDDFRTINKELGYENGDELLKQIVKRLKMVLNDNLLSRFSSDSFAVLINKPITKKEVLFIVEEIFKNLSLPLHINNQYIHLTMSIGIADRTDTIQSSRELLYFAIDAMYEAKKEQTNTWRWYVGDKNNNRETSEVTIRHDLTLALKKEQFQLHYQSIIDSKSKKIIGVEALIRWHHPKQGLVSPEDFIPMAERSGQIFEIGSWVVNQACKDIAKINKNRIVPLQLSVNISPLQFKSPYFLNTISKSLSLHKFEPKLLKIEITEGVLMMESEHSLKILNALQELGVQISIDDFGTEYSSLSYLRHFPINQIKLDKSFIECLPAQKKDAVIVTSLIQMAKNLELEIVAEGVETEEQMNFLAENNCHLLQGFYFSKPLPISCLEILLNKK